MKIVVFCSGSAWEWYAELHAARWAQALKGGRLTYIAMDVHLGDADYVYHLPHCQQ
jgi:hypothetical protein